MNTPTKVILSIVVVTVLSITGLCVGGFYWVRRNAPQIKERVDKAATAGETLGRGGDANACVDETFRRLKDCGTLLCEAEHRLFLVRCLDAAKPPAEFCAGVPPPSEIIASVRWSLAECEKRGMKDSQPCTRLIRAIQDYCHIESKRPSDPTPDDVTQP